MLPGERAMYRLTYFEWSSLVFVAFQMLRPLAVAHFRWSPLWHYDIICSEYQLHTERILHPLTCSGTDEEITRQVKKQALRYLAC
jgi:hypothetical protein